MTEQLLFLDLESWSDTPLKDGTHRYSESSEIMLVSWAFGMNGATCVWDLTARKQWPSIVCQAIENPEYTIVMQNGGNFDRVVMGAHGIKIAPERIHDTMVQALSHGLPGSLDKLGEIFGINPEEAKMKEGYALIREFCMPRPKSETIRRRTRLTHPERWALFMEYAKSDISAMRFLYKNLPRWNYPDSTEFDLWCLDQRINDRGFLVDTDLARSAIDAVNRAQKAHNVRTEEMTDGDVERVGQRDKLLGHLLGEYGVSLPDMTKSTLERRLSDPELPDPVKELISIRLDATTTSTAKYNALLKSVSRDGRLRGTLQFCGASRTGRDAGRIFQPQNLPRPTMKQEDIDSGIKALKANAAHLLFDSPIKLASNALRGSIIAAPGKKLVVADLAQIEARVLPWLAGEQWKLDAFRAYDAGEGPDLYRLGAARVLKKDAEDITSDERQGQGKVPELACGYGGSVGAFHSMANIYGVVVTDNEAKDIVNAWRKANPAVADWDNGLWAKLERAARDAIARPGMLFEAGDKILFEKWRNWLKMILPSGRVLCYADARIEPDPRRAGKTSISFLGVSPYTRQWERRFTYGGKFSAECTQATARDILFSNMPAIEEAGFPIIMKIHDEIITEPLDDINYSVDNLIALLTKTPSWADGALPIAADGFEAYRYKK